MGRLSRLSIHRKLVALALSVSAVALLVTLLGLTLFDIWRYRARASDDAALLAGIVAENSAAAVMFMDQPAAQEILSTVRIREAVTRACIYLADGTLLTAFQRGPDLVCPEAQPTPNGFFAAGAALPIVRNGRTWGTVYVERDFSGLPGRIGVAAAAAAVMLVFAGVLAYLVAQRLTRSISEPIAQLAAEARRIASEPELELSNPDISAGADEVGDLVRAFQDMLSRLRSAHAGLLREIEERKRVEAERADLLRRERETSRMKDEFVATVSHELRTPLGAILGWTQVLEVGRADEAVMSKAIDAISRSADVQARLIEDLVDVSRIAAGKLNLHWESVDLRAPVETSVEVARAAANAKGIRTTVRMPSQPCPVRGDVDRLRQVVGNLLSNAVKFGKTGGTITVVLRDLGGAYEIQVSDDGVGIVPEMLPQVFDRYRQADSSTIRRHDGLGLGLSIVKEVTELHGGSVAVSSGGPGQGATFYLRVPKLLGTRLFPEAGEQNGNGEQVRLDGVRVLAVDDNEDALDVLSEALRAAGASVSTATSGPEALSARFQPFVPIGHPSSTTSRANKHGRKCKGYIYENSA
jgi:signal transduction histidine kinase